MKQAGQSYPPKPLPSQYSITARIHLNHPGNRGSLRSPITSISKLLATRARKSFDMVQGSLNACFTWYVKSPKWIQSGYFQAANEGVNPLCATSAEGRHADAVRWATHEHVKAV